MHSLIAKHKLDINKVSLFATLFGVIFLFIGAVFTFGPMVFDSILPKQLVYQMVDYRWLPISVMTFGVILNILSYRLNTPT